MAQSSCWAWRSAREPKRRTGRNEVCEVAHRALVLAFALGETGPQAQRLHEQGPEQCRHLVGEPGPATSATAGHNTALVVGHRFLGHPAQAHEAAEHGGAELGRGAPEGEDVAWAAECGRVVPSRKLPGRRPCRPAFHAGVPPVKLRRARPAGSWCVGSSGQPSTPAAAAPAAPSTR